MRTIPCKLNLKDLINILTFFAGISENKIMNDAIFSDKDTQMMLAKLGKSMHDTFSNQTGMDEEVN